MTPAGPPLDDFSEQPKRMVNWEVYFAKPCAKTLGRVSTHALKRVTQLGLYIRKPSQVISTVQLKPKMDMKPKFRCYELLEEYDALLLKACWAPNLQHGIFAQPSQVGIVIILFGVQA